MSLLTQVYSRRLLFHTPLYTPHSVPVPGPMISGPLPEPGATTGSSFDATTGSSFDANVVLILAILLCALICALGLNSIVRCALRCSDQFGFEYGPVQTPRFRRKVLRALPVTVYSDGLKITGSGSECAICLSDLLQGQRIRVLPKCGHGFHVRCIDRWLMTRPSCPTCRQCLSTSTSKKSSGCGEATRANPPRSILVPLEPEGLIHNYRDDS